MANTKFCTINSNEIIEKFNRNPHLKELFPNLYKQVLAQTDDLNKAYPQTYILNNKAAKEYVAFSHDEQAETERMITDDHSFPYYTTSNIKTE